MNTEESSDVENGIKGKHRVKKEEGGAGKNCLLLSSYIWFDDMHLPSTNMMTLNENG